MDDQPSGPNETPNTNPTPPDQTQPESLVAEPQPAAIIESVEPAPEPEPAVSPPQPKTSWKMALTPKKRLLIYLLLLFVAAGAVLAFMLIERRDGADVAEDTDHTSEFTQYGDATEEDLLAELENQQEATAADSNLAGAEMLSVDWYGAPRPVSYQPIFAEGAIESFYDPARGYVPINPDDLMSNILTFEMGTLAGQKLYVVLVGDAAMFEGYSQLVFVENGDSYTVFALMSDFYTGETPYWGPTLTNGVVVDVESLLAGLYPPDTITYDGVQFTKLSNWYLPDYIPIFGEDITKFTKLGTVTEGDLYDYLSGDENGNGVKTYKHLLKMPSGALAQYFYALGELADDYSLTIDWNGDGQTTHAYRWDGTDLTCGSSDAVNVLSRDYHGDLVARGQTAGGKTVYELNSADHLVVQDYYENYSMAPGPDGTVTRQQFYDNHGLIAIKNELDFFVLLVDTRYQAQVECAKPVIYLYPETPTILTVKVGADITQSEPLYNGGWTVLALPNGLLLHSSGLYDSLFWDGTGWGSYPEITQGFVVPTADIEQVLTDHLTRLGLNLKERADFLEFWLPLMPDEPYTRLTWLNTEDMNRLAPLKISKTPDTLIRVFLDYRGLEQPIKLAPQTLTSIPRQGFTVVEWGGLRIGN